jgi:chemotaxis protein CheD
MTIMQKKELCTIHPGEWYFGGDYARLHTLLGSCIALTAWHPELKVGGLCHYLLPASPYDKRLTDALQPSKNDYRYADKVLAAMKSAMQRFAGLKEFHIGIFGGGDMFAYSGTTSIGFDNIAYARQWLVQEQLQPFRVDVGGAISRSLSMIIATGEIHVKHYQMNSE